MNCPNCGMSVAEEHSFCPNCGQPIADQAPVVPQPTYVDAPEVITPTAPVPPIMPELDTPAPPVKKKSKKKIIIITAIVTALAIIAGILSWIFIFSKESVWLITSEIYYDANGTAYQKVSYEYNDKGLPLKWTSDIGASQEVWNETAQCFEYISLPYDGQVDSLYEWSYAEEGHMESYREKWEDHDYNSEGAFEYHYDKKGRIESVDCFPMKLTGGYGDEVTAVLHYCYDDNGNLIEIYQERVNSDNNYIKWCNDFRYDSKNRLIGYTNRKLEACYYYQFEYNDKGQLTEMSRSMAHSQVPLDDNHVANPEYQIEGEFHKQQTTEFFYDSKDRLIREERNGKVTFTCDYDSKGNITSITKDGTTYTFIDGDANPDDTDVVMVRDKDGNIIKKIYSDGRYVAYTYQEFRLSEEEAQVCRNAQTSMHRTHDFDLFAYSDTYFGFLQYVSFPFNEHLNFNIITKKG